MVYCSDVDYTSLFGCIVNVLKPAKTLVWLSKPLNSVCDGHSDRQAIPKFH